MASIVSNCVLKVLCDNHGSMVFGQLDNILRQSITTDDRVLLRVLSDEAKFFVVEDKQKSSADTIFSPESLVIAKTLLRVCKNQDKCDECEELHLCRYLVCGNCKFGTNCKRSHDLKSLHNSALLGKFDLQYLETEQVFQLLLQNDPSLVPEVCSHYNKGNGKHGSCKYEISCTNLHLCQHFLQDNCKFGAACKRAHSFDANAMKMLNGRGFSPKNLQILHKICKNKLLLDGNYKKPISKGTDKGSTAGSIPAPLGGRQFSSQQSSSYCSGSDHNEICLFYVRKGCSFKEKCVRIHHNLPYKWEILDKDGVTWRPLPREDDIERAYCNPASDISSGLQPVNFLTMKCAGSQVRRLSTASSVTKPPHFILTTEWLWYWKNDQGAWTEYGQGEDAKLLSPVTSNALENVYLAEVDTEIPFTLGNNNYVIFLKDMYQINIKYKTKRDIRRRPRFISSEDVMRKLKSEGSESSSSSSVVVPAHWDSGALPSYSYNIVHLTSSAPEYKRVEMLFKRTMPTSKIHSIQRVQNPSLWKVFHWQKEQMKERNEGRDVDERYLFHGTDESLIAPICEQNFDWRVCGVHGSLYGKGSYFARDAKYSDKYVKRGVKSDYKMMFVALVLVGEFTKGTSKYLRPPQKKGKLGFYDSCVDNELNPAIFVIFEKYQIYPEYIIKYS
ncbi:protein mono-ADP-ribosyltransferase PARP12-like isoform X2 [Electrophorus electricus]|uniref:protein mono-ADP-ribosyltransferase PARP12-like isoform X2 n=1 Tax=Electrophorus electricus TaxID=8005 RepID=UPI0015D05A26|nr:protein mono-ADP-ribosyltransferase PARP12-like isoform X2 [Electrophorus electricus]